MEYCGLHEATKDARVVVYRNVLCHECVVLRADDRKDQQHGKHRHIADKGTT
jgi:hypothetical protein